MSGYHLIGVDLGGTKVATALLDTDLTVVARSVEATRVAEGVEGVARQVIAAVRGLTQGHPSPGLLGVGVAAAGLVEPESGRVVFSPNLGWRDAPLGDLLRAELGREVYVGNDVNMAALGELHCGAGQGARHMACVFVGTGIGAGLVLDGHLYAGAHGFAGEVGHTSIAWDGLPCPAGNPGCWEAYASGTAMARRAREALAAGAPSALRARWEADPLGVRVEDLARAVEAGDPLATRLIAETAEYLGAGLANLINLLDPERIVLGGGVIRGVPTLFELAEASARRRALPDATAAVTFRRAHFGREAGVIGAAVLVKLAGKT